MNKKIFLLFIFVFLIVGASAQSFVFKKEQAVDFKFRCFDSNGAHCGSDIGCQISTEAPNGTNVQNNKSMTFNDTFFNTSLVTANVGTYTSIIVCNGANSTTSEFSYQITLTGVKLTEDKAMIYLGMLIVLIFLFVVDIRAIMTLPAGNTVVKEEEIITINHLKYLRAILIPVAYLLVMAIIYISSNVSFLYLETTLVGDLFIAFYKIMLALILPILFIWVAWLLLMFRKDRTIKRLMERGLPVGNL